MTFEVTQGGQLHVENMQFDWQGIDGLSAAQQEQINAGNYGNIQNVVVQGDRLIVQTDLGTMTFTGPELDDVEAELKTEGYIETGIKLQANQAMFDVFAALALLFETGMELRKASREARFAEMETVFSLNMAAADKLRESANWALAGAIISGAISIGSGLYSVRGGMKMTAMAAQMQTTPAATQTQSQQTQQAQQQQQVQQQQVQQVQQQAQQPQTQQVQQQQQQVQQQQQIQQQQTQQVQQQQQSQQVQQQQTQQTQQQTQQVQQQQQAQQTQQQQQTQQNQQQQQQQAQQTKDTKSQWEIDSSNKRLELRINALNQKLMGWNSIAQGAGQIGKGIGDFGAQTAQAESKEQEAHASKHQAFMEDAKEFMDEAGKLVDAVRDSLRAIQDSEAQAMRTVLRS